MALVKNINVSQIDRQISKLIKFDKSNMQLLVNIANSNSNFMIRGVIGNHDTMPDGTFTMFLCVVDQFAVVQTLVGKYKFVAPCPPICNDDSGGQDNEYKLDII